MTFRANPWDMACGSRIRIVKDLLPRVYREAAAKLAWEHTIACFKEHRG